MKMGLAEWLMLITLSIFWGGSFLFVGIAVTELPPLTIVLVRVGLSAVILQLVLIVLGQRFPTAPKIILAFFIMGLLNNAIPFSLIVWGQTHIASGLASILNAITPIFTVIVARFATRDEKLTKGKMIGVTIGFLGVATMIGLDALSGIGTNILAQLAILAAALSYAFAGAFGRKFKELGIAPMQVATGQVSASALLILPLVLLVDQPWQLEVPRFETLIALIGLAVISTVLAYILYFRILATSGATNLLLVTFLVPPSAIIFGLIFLQERLNSNHILGMVLIAISLILVDGRLRIFPTKRNS